MRLCAYRYFYNVKYWHYHWARCKCFGSDFQPKYIPPFKWGKSDKTELEKFFQIIEIMKKRRKVKLNEVEKELLSKIFASN